jgi:hypothetical protein
MGVTGIDGRQVLHTYLPVQKTWVNAKVDAMREVSFLKRDAAIGGKHVGLSRSFQI